MDDPELEARLRARLHSRFDVAQVPAELTGNVRQAITTNSRRVGFALRAGGLRFGWAAVAALAVIVAAVVVAGNLAGPNGPGNRPSAIPVQSAGPSERYFIVLPPTPAVPSKPETILAGAILSMRLQALGFGTFTSSGGIEIRYRMPVAGPADDVVEDVLRATGKVEFIPLPPGDYGQFNDGPNQAVLGEPLPKDETALFGWDGIESVALDSSNERPTLAINFKPAAAAAFGDYTTAHVGEYFAIVIDGRVVSLPLISEPITVGKVQLPGAGEDDGAFTRLAAILVGGMLPEAWAHPVVPHVAPVERFIPALQFENPDATFVSAELGVFESNTGFPWVPVWRMTFAGSFPQCSPADALPTFCPDGNLVVTVDAETGVGIP